MNNEKYPWVDKTYDEMTPKLRAMFKECYNSLWYYYNKTNGFQLYAENSKGKTIYLETDISENRYYNFTWLHKPLNELTVGETCEFTELFQCVMYCLVVVNQEDFILMNLGKIMEMKQK